MRVFVATLAMIAFASPVVAFDTQQTVVPQAAQSAGAETAKQPAPQLGLESGRIPKPEEDGTTIQIPGLGRLGVIPKLDFGLDLLYGSKSDETASLPQGETTDDDSLRIRGTIRHRF